MSSSRADAGTARRILHIAKVLSNTVFRVLPWNDAEK